ncbi:uncharacterized protein LOC133199962 [Saccostrea echinata]|uniref:uncharacterized protein LOC133199962 n=1 Tax=Saccostrea echinata TaxID=191078 RepID=UPI002A7EBBE6|nr:uncharacterized protein LOC133199962 [Saccostrea echinata]
MAQKYLDMMEQEKARTFQDFEDEWVALGEELCVHVFQPGYISFKMFNDRKVKNSKEEENATSQPPLSRKRKLTESSDSYILSQRLKQHKRTDKENIIITNIRKEDPMKFEKLEERIRGNGTPGYLETSRGFKTTTAIVGYPSQSPPECNTGFNTAAATTTKSRSPHGCPPPPPQSPEYKTVNFARLACGVNPLQRELDALNELIDSMRVDLLQTSMLIDYVKDFLKNYEF